MIEWLIGLAAAGLGAKAIYDHTHPPLQSLKAVHQVTGQKVQVVVPVKTSALTPQPPHVITDGGISPISINTPQDVQKALNTLGMASPALIVDGQIGPKSKAAIVRFESTAGMNQDGLVSSGLKIALQNALTSTAGAKALSTQIAQATAQIQAATSGMNLNYLPDLQNSLNLLGASPALDASGSLDTPTIAALKAFQLVHGLDASGNPDQGTQNAIHAAVADLSTPEQPFSPATSDIESQGLADIQAEDTQVSGDQYPVGGEVTIQHGDLIVKHS